MKKFKNIISYSICKKGIKGLFKTPTIMVTDKNNVGYPVCYLKKPKHLTNKEFEFILDGIKLFIEKDN